MEHKNIVATIYLKDGQAVASMKDFTPVEDVYKLCQLYNDSGIDKIIIFDLSTSDEEHEKNIHTIENINRNIEIKVCAGGNINRLEDVKKLLYAGCLQVIFNASKPSSVGLAGEASARFGKDRILVSVNNVDFLFKNQQIIEDTFHEVLVLNPSILDALENLTNIPYVVNLPEYNYEEIVSLLKREKIRGIAGPFINMINTDIMKLKSELSQEGIKMDNFAPDLHWSDLKLNSDGMVPVIVQDYRTDEVLMLAYMNEESLLKTLETGYTWFWSRSRQELWNKGATSGNLQKVVELFYDCDGDALLVKVEQQGVACHTGEYSCFHNPLWHTSNLPVPEVEGLPKVISELYRMILYKRQADDAEMKFLMSGSQDKLLQKLGNEITETIIASKNGEKDKVLHEMADLWYHCLVLLAYHNITPEELLRELGGKRA